VTVCTVPILVSGVCAEACQWCIEQWVTMAAVGMFATAAGELRQQSPYRAHWGSQAQMLAISAPTLQSGLRTGYLCV